VQPIWLQLAELSDRQVLNRAFRQLAKFFRVDPDSSRREGNLHQHAIADWETDAILAGGRAADALARYQSRPTHQCATLSHVISHDTRPPTRLPRHFGDSDLPHIGRLIVQIAPSYAGTRQLTIQRKGPVIRLGQSGRTPVAIRLGIDLKPAKATGMRTVLSSASSRANCPGSSRGSDSASGSTPGSPAGAGLYTTALPCAR
jgi:hypothetical protein